MIFDPYRIDTPAIVRFSGGRTSGFMLHRIVQAFGGSLPDDVHVVFSNTGKERPETLDFVRECGERWRVRIRWVEWRRELPHCREMTYETAARNGEPFDELNAWKGMLPNPATKTCSQNLKMWSTWHFAIHVLGLEEWTAAIGIRHDEPRRWGMIGPDRTQKRATNVAPLVDAKVTERDVMAFWCKQSFDLQLRQHEGNCDLCFMKPLPTLDRIMRERPDLAEWWVRWERAGLPKAGGMWRNDRPRYATLLDRAKRQLPLINLEEHDARPCVCGD